MKISTRFFAHPRIMRLSHEDIGTYVLAASAASEQGTDGVVPSTSLYFFDLTPLVEVGLVRQSVGGHEFVRWSETPERANWHVLGHPDDPHPLLAIASAWAVQNRARTRKVPASLRAAVFSRDGGICGICRELVEGEFHCDHIVPFSLGGETAFENLQVAHPECNLRKGARPQE